MPVEPQDFKNALSHWASGVTVVTTVSDGQWKGATVSSFSSVSLNPPLVLICLNKNMYTHEVIIESGIFAANILSTNHLEAGKLFAGMYPEIEDRFSQNEWITAETGAPILADAVGWVDCTVKHAYDGGDHTIFVGEVQAGGVKAGEPILYFNRQWGQFGALE